MKKNIILILSILSVTVIACHKKHICECTLVDNGTGKTLTTADTAKLGKKDAAIWCNNHGAGTAYKTTCVLK